MADAGSKFRSRMRSWVRKVIKNVSVLVMCCGSVQHNIMVAVELLEVQEETIIQTLGCIA